MSFFAVLFALMLEQIKPLPRDNWVHDALASWTRWAGRNFDAGRPHHARIVWVVTVLVPAGAAALIHVLISRYSFFLALAFDVLAMLDPVLLSNHAAEQHLVINAGSLSLNGVRAQDVALDLNAGQSGFEIKAFDIGSVGGASA